MEEPQQNLHDGLDYPGSSLLQYVLHVDLWHVKPLWCGWRPMNNVFCVGHEQGHNSCIARPLTMREQNITYRDVVLRAKHIRKSKVLCAKILNIDPTAVSNPSKCWDTELQRKRSHRRTEFDHLPSPKKTFLSPAESPLAAPTKVDAQKSLCVEPNL